MSSILKQWVRYFFEYCNSHFELVYSQKHKLAIGMKASTFFFGHKTTLVLFILFAIVLMAATFIEASYGTAMARKLVYNSILFETLLALIAINVTGNMLVNNTFILKKISVPLYHLTFVLIIVGAFLTRYTGVEGTVMIREGGKTNKVFVDNENYLTLPFEIELTDFVLERYPGSHSPSSYSSFVKVSDEAKNHTFDYHIYMNHILKYRGWRFFQSSYDRDEKGTILSASRDIFGTPVTYAGYILAMLLMLSSLILPGTFFRKQLKKLQSIPLIAALIIIPLLAQANSETDYAADKKYAEKFGKLVVQDQGGRMKPLNTLNREFMRKIYGKERFYGLTADQVVLSMATFSEYWKTIPIIKVPNKEIRKLLNTNEKYIAFNELYDTAGNYIPGEYANRLFMKPRNELNKTEKALIALDEKANIFHSFMLGSAYPIFPVKGLPNNKWHSPTDAYLFALSAEDSIFLKSVFINFISELARAEHSNEYFLVAHYYNEINEYQKSAGGEVFPEEGKISAEISYNKLNIFGRLRFVFATTGFIMLLFVFFFILRGKLFPKPLFIAFKGINIVLFAIMSYGFGLRWYIGGFIPMSNSYEVMVFLAAIVLPAGLLTGRKLPSVPALAFILAFTFLLVAGMNNSNPEIGTLVPVLKSFWLSLHVAVITSSYALFALVMMMAFVNMLLFLTAPANLFQEIRARAKQLGALMQVLLIIGLYLLTIGSILGAIWANESWGRYWGWDPKETWALISILVYALVTHMRLIPIGKDDFLFNVAAFWSFSSILMTFFGVNYLLTGLHSYGGSGQGIFPLWIAVVALFLIIFTSFAGIRYYKNGEMR